MTIKLSWLLLLSALFVTTSCHNNQNALLSESEVASGVEVNYAEGFRISDYGEIKVLRFFYKGDTTTCDSMVLYPEGAKIPFSYNCKSVKIPVSSVACLSATHLSFIDKIGMIDKITGVTSLEYSVFPSIESSIKNGKIKEIAIGGKFKAESLIALNPDIVFVSPMKNQSLIQLENSGLILIPVGEFLETTPLGRAEWVKYISCFFNAEDVAENVFDSLELRYLHLKSLTSKQDKINRPTVFSGNLISGVWYLPGGKSYESAFFNDAGANYLWKDDTNTGSISLDFETVYAKAHKADYWRLVVFTDKTYSFDLLLSEDERYNTFQSFVNRHIFYCNSKQSPLYQVGVLEPHVILADYICVFHPELLPGYKPVYYRLLNE